VPELLSRKVWQTFAEAEALVARSRELAEVAWNLEAGLEAVKADETEKNAEAARKGETIPESKVPAIEREVRAKRTEADALKQASRNALRDAIDLLASEYAETSAKADALLAEKLKATLAACDVLEAALAGLDEAFLARMWAAHVADGNHPPRTRARYATRILKPSGEPHTVDELVGVIRSTVGEMIERHGFAAEPDAS
jgi:hypothetical protein